MRIQRLTFLILACCLLGSGLFAQDKQKDKEEKVHKKIVIIKKSVDEDGNEVEEKIIREGKAAEEFEFKSEDGKTIHIEIQYC